MLKKENRKMHSICESTAQVNWLQRLGVAGFIFFLAKGLVWIAAAIWLAY